MIQRIPSWQRWLSYLAPYPLAHFQTPDNGPMQLRIVGGRLQLTTRNAIYSYEDRYTSFLKALFVIEERLPGIESLLILGFGFGSIPMILHKRFDLHPQIVGIDHDGELIRQFHRFYAADNIQLIEADAKAYLEKTENTFDLICIDLFKDALVPKKFESDRFLRTLTERLNPKGLVLYNRLTMEPGLATATENFYHHQFSQSFPDAYYVDTGGNWILVGEKPVL